VLRRTLRKVDSRLRGNDKQEILHFVQNDAFWWCEVCIAGTKTRWINPTTLCDYRLEGWREALVFDFRLRTRLRRTGRRGWRAFFLKGLLTLLTLRLAGRRGRPGFALKELRRGKPGFALKELSRGKPEMWREWWRSVRIKSARPRAWAFRQMFLT